MEAVKSVKNVKSSGPDRIIAELITYSIFVCVEFSVKLFNDIFDKGIYTDNWTESVILPLHKKGNVSDPNNYQGISFLFVTSTLYSAIIYDRLQTLIEINDIVGQHQEGFRADYSTSDALTLLAIVQKQFTLNNKEIKTKQLPSKNPNCI